MGGLHGPAPVLAIFGMEKVEKYLTVSDVGGCSTPNKQKRESEETGAEVLGSICNCFKPTKWAKVPIRGGAFGAQNIGRVLHRSTQMSTILARELRKICHLFV
jgi:hypothetical protein